MKYLYLPITSRVTLLSIGKGSERNVKGSNLTLVYWQVRQRTLDLSCKIKININYKPNFNVYSLHNNTVFMSINDVRICWFCYQPQNHHYNTKCLITIYKYTYTIKAIHSYHNKCFCVIKIICFDVSREMTATNNAISIGLSLSILCMGIVCASESDFQSSIAELRTLMIGQQDTITELQNEVARQSQMILKQEETIHQLE